MFLRPHFTEKFSQFLNQTIAPGLVDFRWNAVISWSFAIGETVCGIFSFLFGGRCSKSLVDLDLRQTADCLNADLVGYVKHIDKVLCPPLLPHSIIKVVPSALKR